MPWFRNHYRCARCHHRWSDEWSATCDDDCPECGARHMSPTASDDLSAIVEEKPDGRFAVLWSPETAEHAPDYSEVACFLTRGEALAFIDGGGAERHMARRLATRGAP